MHSAELTIFTFTPGVLAECTYNVAAPWDTWGLLNNQGILIRNQELKQFKAIKIDGLIGTCNKAGFSFKEIINANRVPRIAEILFSKILRMRR